MIPAFCFVVFFCLVLVCLCQFGLVENEDEFRPVTCLACRFFSGGCCGRPDWFVDTFAVFSGGDCRSVQAPFVENRLSPYRLSLVSLGLGGSMSDEN